jgi:hypothetical protein
MEMSIREHCSADIASTRIGIVGSTEEAYFELEAVTKKLLDECATFELAMSQLHICPCMHVHCKWVHEQYTI